MRRTCCGKEEDTEGVLFCDGVFGGDFWESCEARADGKPGDVDFLFRNVFVNKDFFGVVISYEEVMTRRA